jgi:hypothetical protein
MSTRAIFAVLVTCLVAVLLLGLWLRRHSEPQAPVEVPPTVATVASPRPTETAGTPTVSAASGSRRHRLAGTVVGDVSYAVIEGPDGTSALYRPGETVPGLGRIVDIGPDRVTIEGDHGRVDLQLAAAPTPTPAPPSPEPRESAEAPTTRARRRSPDRSESEAPP